MPIIPGLTSTIPELIPAFVADLAASEVRAIALFPTLMSPTERQKLYRDLESIDGLTIAHVHARTDFDEPELDYLTERFATEVFNIHPRLTRHAFGPVPRRYANRFFVENVDAEAEDAELATLGGICPDYSHLEKARHLGWSDYVRNTESQLERFPIGCCHISAIRLGEPNSWDGGPDHHNFRALSDFDYLARYRRWLPARRLSLELENPLAEQLEAIPYLERVLELAPNGVSAGR